MDTACLEAQFRTLGRQCQCQCQSKSNTDLDTASTSSRMGAAGASGFVREETGDAAVAAATATLSPRTIACGGDCCGSPENQIGGAAGGGGGEQQSRDVSNSGSDARSRLSGAATGMVGGATAVVAIATKVGEVRRVWFYVCT